MRVIPRKFLHFATSTLELAKLLLGLWRNIIGSNNLFKSPKARKNRLGSAAAAPPPATQMRKIQVVDLAPRVAMHSRTYEADSKYSDTCLIDLFEVAVSRLLVQS